MLEKATLKTDAGDEEFEVFQYTGDNEKELLEIVPLTKRDEKMDGLEYDLFTRWMEGQTCCMGGVYKWDLERFINGRRVID